MTGPRQPTEPTLGSGKPDDAPPAIARAYLTIEQLAAHPFRWRLGTREGGNYADGRSNPQNVGRHSLGTRARQEALECLRRLDLVKAVEFGLAKEDLLKECRDALLSLDDGRERYL